MTSCSGRNFLNSRVVDLEHKIFIETARRQEAEKALLQYRSQQAQVPSNKLEPMQVILGEIERVKEEKKSILEWLERGVVEAERVSKQLSQISGAIHHAETFENEANQTLQKMNNHHNELQQILHGMNMQVRLMQQEITEKKSNDAVKIALNNSSKKTECDPLLDEYIINKNKLENLKDKCVLLEKAEGAMGCLAACSRRLLQELGKLSVAVNSSGVWEDSERTYDESDFSDSEDGADDRHHPQVLFSSAKVAIDRCDSCLCTIWSGLSRVGLDQVHLRRQQDIQFQEACMAVERDLTTTVENCAAGLQELRDELEMWKNKQRLFERLVSEAESAYQSDVIASLFQREDAGGPNKGFDDGDESAGAFADTTKRKAFALGGEHCQLKLTNDKLKRQLDVLMSDYKSVKELKHAYRDLELRKTELARVNEKLRMSNRWMKQCTWEVDEEYMRRFQSWGLVSAGFAQRFNSDSFLHDIFSELDACDITQRNNHLKMENPTSLKKMPSSGTTATPGETATAEEADILAELSKQEHLQRLVQEAREQAALSQAEEAKKEEVRRHACYVASPPARLPLSTAELIQEKSPQHFTPVGDSSTRVLALPHLESPGTVAVVTLVGKVLSEAQMDEEDSVEETTVNSVDENGPHARFLVQYHVPFLPTSRPVTVQVRCYGATLASFVKRHVKLGDLVHVLGHVLPLDSTSTDGPAFCVCALPAGGNISVVLSAGCVTAS